MHSADVAPTAYAAFDCEKRQSITFARNTLVDVTALETWCVRVVCAIPARGIVW